jgi:alkylation response protein AidB-like acyl-CoA dehydrogenase
MNFELSDEQTTIKRTAREFLAAREADWGSLVDLGWPGLFIAEEHGGMGLGMVELAVVAEELGYALARTPLQSSWAAALLVHDGDVLSALASGSERGTIAEDGLAFDAEGADVLVTGEGWTRDFSAAPVDGLDLTRPLFEVSPGSTPEAADRVQLMLAAESVGIAQRCLELSVEYAKERRQFGKPVGSFQAVSHMCAQMLLETESARSLVLNAAWCLDHAPDDAPLAVAMAKAYASDAGVRVAGTAIQVHGGIGMTWEHDLHLFLRRAQVNAQSFSPARACRERVAELLSL